MGIFNAIEYAQPIQMSGTVRRLHNSPIIVSPEQINTLLWRSDCLTSRLDKQYKVLRFLLRSNGELVFAAEGYPSKHIPAHYQMAKGDPQCISAGNAYFDEHHKLCIINNQSGDYRPSFDSLQFALSAFRSFNVPMERVIKINKLNSRGVYEQSYFLNTENIITPTPAITSTVASSYQNKLEACGVLGTEIMQQIKRLEVGSNSYNPYWMNSSKKLKAIIDSLNKLSPKIDEASLKMIAVDPREELYNALNIQRISPLTFFGRLGWNNAKSLQSVHDVVSSMPDVGSVENFIQS